ncbi:uncharacterized protein PAC_02734 [Phialocephala subalpina]|uniref:Protein kinase domain-containing protein n=1 Tax=Phialocephala subalpina TaxID=576137 RepID=A0A1L7WJA3_9HELO|nr:uncharacterized protein PAC_02734 [Phialocephala subalpina]
MVLGNGTNDVCGRWDYIGNKPNMPKHMVVKQCTSLAPEKTDLYVESEMLKALSSTGTTHAPQLYREFHFAGGTGVTKRNEFDGTEDPIIPDPMWSRNTLLGQLDEDESRRFPPLKLADFGLSRFEPKTEVERRGTGWITGTQWRGTPGYLAPEQYFYNRKPGTREISTKVNIWQVGAVLYRLICREDVAIESYFTQDAPPDIYGYQATYDVSGNPDVLLDPVQCPCSSRLIGAICYRLAQLPHRRMSTQELVVECSKVLEIYDAQNALNTGDAMAGQNIPPRGSNKQNFDMPDIEIQTREGDQPLFVEVPMVPTDQLFNPLFPKGRGPYVYNDVDDYPHQFLGDTPSGKRGVRPPALPGPPVSPIDPNLPNPSPVWEDQLGTIQKVEETPEPNVEA